MKIKAIIKAIAKDWQSGRYNITFEMIEGNIYETDSLKDKELSVEAKQWREPRSGKANKLLWGCLTDITRKLREENKDPDLDKWDIYLGYIKRYGLCELIRILPERYPRLQQQWRETEIIGHPIENGVEKYDVLCYYGSSTYDSKEFATLLDDVIADMKNMGIPTPTSQEMKRALEELEKEEASAKTT